MIQLEGEFVELSLRLKVPPEAFRESTRFGSRKESEQRCQSRGIVFDNNVGMLAWDDFQGSSMSFGCRFGVGGALCGTWSVAGVKRICRSGKLDLLNRTICVLSVLDMTDMNMIFNMI